MKKNIVILWFCVLNLFACKHDDFDAEQAAKDYCNCLQSERQSGKDFFDARTKCDGELLAKNRFFRIDYMDMNVAYRNYTLFLSQGLRDSVADFRSRFYEYLEKHCCQEAVMGCDQNDSLQIKMKLLESK